MFCNECGTENRNDRKFCTNCGAQLIDYTKPRENLVMPEDVENKQKLIAKKNSLTKKFNIALTLILIAAISLASTAFCFADKLRIYLGASALILCAIFVVVWFAKVIKIKKLNKDLN